MGRQRNGDELIFAVDCGESKVFIRVIFLLALMGCEAQRDRTRPAVLQRWQVLFSCASAAYLYCSVSVGGGKEEEEDKKRSVKTDIKKSGFKLK